MRKNCSRDQEKLLKLEAEGREFAKFLRSLESGSWKYLIHNELKKKKLKLETNHYWDLEQGLI